jgi:hypothetical protein
MCSVFKNEDPWKASSPAGEAEMTSDIRTHDVMFRDSPSVHRFMADKAWKAHRIHAKKNVAWTRYSPQILVA